MKIKMILIKKANTTTTTTTTEIFKCSKTTCFLMPRTLEIVFPSFFFFYFSGGACLRSPRGKGPYGPFSGHSRLSHLQWPLITTVNETPATPFILKENEKGAFEFLAINFFHKEKCYMPFCQRQLTV